MNREETEATQEFWDEKLSHAWSLRRLQGFPNDSTSLFRLVHGEGDGLPGLIVDVYGDTAVLQAHSLGMYLIREELAKAIVSRGLSVRAAETLAQQHSTARKPLKRKAYKDPDTRALEQRIAGSLGLVVDIDDKGTRGGKVTIKYKTLEQLEEITDRLMS